MQKKGIKGVRNPVQTHQKKRKKKEDKRKTQKHEWCHKENIQQPEGNTNQKVTRENTPTQHQK
tara:strand:- start:69 stop:257 length:189 start_codon:yes stop_codon:yes gene_type:complete